MQKQKRKPGESYHVILPPSASLIPCPLLHCLPPPHPPPPPPPPPSPYFSFFQPTSFADPRDDELKKREEVCLSCPHTASICACICQYLDERGHEIIMSSITGMLDAYMRSVLYMNYFVICIAPPHLEYKLKQKQGE